MTTIRNPNSTATYIKISFRQMLRAIKWCQNALNLRDWTIDLEAGDAIPALLDRLQNDENRVGLAYNQVDISHFHAQIWVSLDRCKENDAHPIEVICHEMLHVFLSNYGIKSQDEQMIVTLQHQVFQNWLNGQKRSRKKNCRKLRKV